VIPGWTEALQLMRPGDDWLVYLPSDIAYGERGTPGGPIPPDADLIFRVNLVDVTKPEISDAVAWARLVPWKSDVDGVQKTESGLEYVVLESGAADAPQPTARDQVSVYYEGRLAETGETFDSAYARGEPISFGVTQVIPGWTEALQLMRKGDRWMVYLPANIAYGAAGRPGIPPNSDLIFEVQVMDVITP
ncbi:MAG: FKBP-type peptidyl-prolyl cis-trans isomerase, partial [Pseudomonadota bacterium]